MCVCLFQVQCWTRSSDKIVILSLTGKFVNLQLRFSCKLLLGDSLARFTFKPCFGLRPHPPNLVMRQIWDHCQWIYFQGSVSCPSDFFIKVSALRAWACDLPTFPCYDFWLFNFPLHIHIKLSPSKNLKEHKNLINEIVFKFNFI